MVTEAKTLPALVKTLLPATVAATLLWMANASAAELCRFAGTTDYQGRVTITTETATGNGATQVDVVATVAAWWNFLLPIQYLTEEISSWRGEELQSVAVNYRYLVGSHIVRQNWDVFERRSNAMQGWRVQGKTLSEFREKHPGFAQHWETAGFGQSWLPDYRFASPERRRDLDLDGARLPPGLRSPLAMAFYWVRFLPHHDVNVPVFLPGFKADKIIELPIRAIADPNSVQWRAPLRYPALSATPASGATVWVSADGHLQQLAFELHGSRGSVQGLIHQEGCEEVPTMPTEGRR